jgi:hypothetical protein
MVLVRGVISSSHSSSNFEAKAQFPTDKKSALSRMNLQRTVRLLFLVRMRNHEAGRLAKPHARALVVQQFLHDPER